MTTVLAVLDMQNWMFQAPAEAAKLPVLVRGVNRALAAADALEWLIFEIRTEWPNDPDTWSIRAQRSHESVPLAGTAGVQSVTGLQFPSKREVVIKTRRSAFVWTNFEARLQRKRVTRLYLAGCWLDGSISLTAIDAHERNIDTAILADAVASVDDGHSHFVGRWIAHLGDIPCMPLDDAIKWTQVAVR
jgi:nicotinamidase-related amidase